MDLKKIRNRKIKCGIFMIFCLVLAIGYVLDGNIDTCLLWLIICGQSSMVDHIHDIRDEYKPM